MKPRDEKEMEQALLDTGWSRDTSLQRLPFQDRPEFSDQVKVPGDAEAGHPRHMEHEGSEAGTQCIG